MDQSCNKKFSKSHMLLDSKKFGIFDVLYVIFFKNLHTRNFIDCSEEAQEEIRNCKWIIFASVVIQKLLSLLAKPLARLGLKIEYWLNLISGNGGFSGLIKNFLRGFSYFLFQFLSQ